MVNMQPRFQFTITKMLGAVCAASLYFAILRLLDLSSRPAYLAIGFYVALIGGTMLWMDRTHGRQP